MICIIGIQFCFIFWFESIETNRQTYVEKFDLIALCNCQPIEPQVARSKEYAMPSLKGPGEAQSHDGKQPPPLFPLWTKTHLFPVPSRLSSPHWYRPCPMEYHHYLLTRRRSPQIPPCSGGPGA